MGEYRTTTGEAPPLPARDRRRRQRQVLIFTAAGLLAIAAAGMVIRVRREILASGYVTTQLYAEVRPSAPGVVTEIHAFSGKPVQAGDLLVQLDDSEERAAHNEAVSRIRKIEAEIVRAESELAEQERDRKGRIAMATLELDHATARVQVTRELKERGLASGQALRDVELRQQLAQALLDGLEDRDPTLGAKSLAVMRQDLEANRSAAERIDARIRARRVCAPMAGKIVRYSFAVGELVRPETVLYEVFGGEGQVLKVRVPERFATLVRPGQAYRAKLTPFRRGLRHEWFKGQVEELRDVIQSENQKTYRVTYCTFDPKGHDVPPGTTAEARILVGRSSVWSYLLGTY